MPITSSSQFDTLVITCQCAIGEFGNFHVQQGRTRLARSGDTSVMYFENGDGTSPTDPEVAEVISRIQAGTVKVYYSDDAQSPAVWVEAHVAPQEFWQFHGRHPFWPKDGYKMLDRIATKGDLVESTNTRHFAFEGGFVPQRTPAASTNLQHSLSAWSVFRMSTNRVGFRLVIPSSLNVQPAGLHTYPDSQAFVKWLDSFRTEGEAVPDAFATTLGAFTGRRWRPPFDPDNLTLRRFTFRFASLGLTRVVDTQQVIVLTILLDIHEVDSGFDASDFDVNDFAAVVNSSSGTIPGTGQTIEPQFGASDIPARISRLESNDGNLLLAGGLALMQWQDPGRNEQRIMPLSGFGRSINFNNLPIRFGGGRWAPRPEERPRVDLIIFNESTDQQLWFEPADRLVGYAGTDRVISVFNKSTVRSLTLGVEKELGTPTTLLVLQPGERITLRVVYELGGDSEYLVLDAPYRYLVRGGSSFGVTANPYSWTTGGVQFAFRPWFPDVQRTFRRDTDEFTFGAATQHAADTLLTNGLVNSVQAVNVRHNGDLIFYQQTEIEARVAGTLSGGNSSILVRDRGGTVTVIARVWHPELSGVGRHYSYTTVHVDQCEAGDRYVAGLVYPTSATTIPFNQLRINAISQVIRVAPRIIV